jgi:hypothetical protein
MSKRIEKKTLPGLFEEVLSGNKKFDLRLADFDCNKGDFIILREWDPKTSRYTGRKIEKKVTFVFKTKDLDFWPKKKIEKHGFQILSLD